MNWWITNSLINSSLILGHFFEFCAPTGLPSYFYEVPNLQLMPRSHISNFQKPPSDWGTNMGRVAREQSAWDPQMVFGFKSNAKYLSKMKHLLMYLEKIGFGVYGGLSVHCEEFHFLNRHVQKLRIKFQSFGSHISHLFIFEIVRFPIIILWSTIWDFPEFFWVILQKIRKPKSRIMVGDFCNGPNNNGNLGFAVKSQKIICITILAFPYQP